MDVKNDTQDIYIHISQKLKLGELISSQPVQTLWGGYGEIVRLHFSQKTIIVKHIQHPKGWATDLSHQRKLRSFQVEVNWYENFSKIRDDNCPMALGLRSFYDEEQCFIIMEDLGQLGFTKVVKEADEGHLKASISWLGNFHGKYMGVRSDKIWKIGTYWHLETRPDEFEAMEDLRLKSFGKKIDEVLNSCQYQTIVHGDGKLANFCFNEEGTKASAVDFQYVGHGCGMKDLMLFISSSVKPNQCKEKERRLVDFYFDCLEKALKYYHPQLNFQEIEKEWRSLYYVAWADFLRFLKGWSPDHWKINDYSESCCEKGLENLF
ncbi:MAG: ecdysteroid 22-kinase family protein [Campylobacterales bacterium]|nr:ecdysteroid 22-kinase family protein [Campylobacterales bacterium]